MADVHHHIVPPKHYIINFLALGVLMVLTIYAATIDLGSGWNLALALAIATTKATLIVLIFMDVRHASQLTWLFAGAGFFWFLIMISITLVDMNPNVHESMGTPYTMPIAPPN